MAKPLASIISSLLIALCCCAVQSETANSDKPVLTGRWVFNQDASDDVDKLVGKAIKKAGGKIKLPKGVGKNDYARFRGGPKAQEIYDRLAYDRAFTLSRKGADYILVHHHKDDFVREASSKRRTRTITATGGDIDDTSGHSFAYWDGDTLAIETRAADGGYALEQYRLLDSGQLEVFLRLEPVKFPKALSFVRIFERDNASATDSSNAPPRP